MSENENKLREIMNNNTVPCNEINMDSWKAMPKTMRVKDFCRYCEFKCSHGEILIMDVDDLPQCNGGM